MLDDSEENRKDQKYSRKWMTKKASTVWNYSHFQVRNTHEHLPDNRYTRKSEGKRPQKAMYFLFCNTEKTQLSFEDLKSGVIFAKQSAKATECKNLHLLSQLDFWQNIRKTESSVSKKAFIWTTFTCQLWHSVRQVWRTSGLEWPQAELTKRSAIIRSQIRAISQLFEGKRIDSDTTWPQVLNEHRKQRNSLGEPWVFILGNDCPIWIVFLIATEKSFVYWFSVGLK